MNVNCKYKDTFLIQKLSLRLILQYAMNKCWEVAVHLHAFLNKELGRGKMYNFTRRFLDHRRQTAPGHAPNGMVNVSTAVLKAKENFSVKNRTPILRHPGGS